MVQIAGSAKSSVRSHQHVSVPLQEEDNRISPELGDLLSAEIQRLTAKNTFYNDYTSMQGPPVDLRRVVSDSSAQARYTDDARFKQPLKVLPTMMHEKSPPELPRHLAPFPPAAASYLPLLGDEALMEAASSSRRQAAAMLAVDPSSYLRTLSAWPATTALETHLLPPGLLQEVDMIGGVAPVAEPQHQQQSSPPQSPALSEDMLALLDAACRNQGLLPPASAAVFPGAGQALPPMRPSSSAPAAPVGAVGIAAPASGELLAVGRSTSIAELQELLQSSSQTPHFRCPPGAQVLQWIYQQCNSGRVAFRAVVAFLHDGVPKHVAGLWSNSKKVARQSAAELALALLYQRPVCAPEAAAFVDLGDVVPSATAAPAVLAAAATCVGTEAVDKLSDLLRVQFGVYSPPHWHCATQSSGGCFTASLRIPLLGLPHTLRGPASASPEAACSELARRVMWCLGKRDLRGLYEPCVQDLLASNCKVNDAPSEWTDSLFEASAVVPAVL